jgi:hypothetical protein
VDNTGHLASSGLSNLKDYDELGWRRKGTHTDVRFEVLTAVSKKVTVFWVVGPCSLVIALMMEAARTSETLVKFYQTTRRYNPEDSHLRTHTEFG